VHGYAAQANPKAANPKARGNQTIRLSDHRTIAPKALSSEQASSVTGAFARANTGALGVVRAAVPKNAGIQGKGKSPAISSSTNLSTTNPSAVDIPLLSTLNGNQRNLSRLINDMGLKFMFGSLK
jgi:hypothetical protein